MYLLELLQIIFSVPALATIVAVLIIKLYYNQKNTFSYWASKNIPGPPCAPLMGNFFQLLFFNRMKVLLDWQNKYGKIYGMYQGPKPKLVVCDREVAQQICIKDFDVFPNHSVREEFNKFQKNFIFFLKDDQWRRIRATMSPTFTSGKIKRMFKLLDACAEDMISVFKEQLSRNQTGDHSAIVNLKDSFHLYTMDGIATCCYGLKLNRVGASDIKTTATRNEFVRLAYRFFETSYPRMIAMIICPAWFDKYVLRTIGFELFPESTMAPLANKVEQLMESRRNSNKKFDDYLQILLNARIDDTIELDELDQAENHHAGLTEESLIDDRKKMIQALDNNETNQKLRVTLSDQEILSNAMFLLSVGLETTGTLLSNAAYCLGFHRDLQEKLYDEILKISELDETKKQYTFSYETLTSSRYLDAVLSETLRLIPPILMIDRLSIKDYTIEKYNIHLPAGSGVLINYYSLHTDPDYWDEPLKYDPERFMPGNREKIKPGSYLPFGIGPRHCIGMRFSLTEAKLALAKLVMNFYIKPAPGTQFPPEPKQTIGVNTIRNPTCEITPRNPNMMETSA